MPWMLSILAIKDYKSSETPGCICQSHKSKVQARVLKKSSKSPSLGHTQSLIVLRDMLRSYTKSIVHISIAPCLGLNEDESSLFMSFPFLSCFCSFYEYQGGGEEWQWWMSIMIQSKKKVNDKNLNVRS